MSRALLCLLVSVPELLSACAISTVLVPGADKVRITSIPADVAACKAVGNIELPRDAGVNGENILRNQTIGFGGDTAFVTFGGSVAYRCL
jgi:hypothetical protein